MLGIDLVGLPKRTPVGIGPDSSRAQEDARKTIAMHAAHVKTQDSPVNFFKTPLLARQGRVLCARKTF
jgi:hypothetical protein